MEKILKHGSHIVRSISLDLCISLGIDRPSMWFSGGIPDRINNMFVVLQRNHNEIEKNFKQ
jgi:hypothetical protein